MENLNKKPDKHETNKIASLLIVKITKIIIKSLYNMTGNYIYIHTYIY